MKATSPLDLLRDMRRVVTPVPDAEEERARRERISARMLELARELRVRRQRRLRIGVLLAAIVAVSGVVLVLKVPDPFGAGRGSSVTIVSGHIAVREGALSLPWNEATLDLAREPVLATGPGEEVSLQLPSAAAVQVSVASELGLARQAVQGGWRERIRLRAGGVRLRVPKLETNQRLAVETDDAVVEVRGTRFAVRVEHDTRGAFTRVEVQEGRVAVSSARGPALLGPGEAWTSRELAAAPAPLPAAAPEPAPAPALDAAKAQPATSAGKRAPVASEPEQAPGEDDVDVPASVLAEQNRLLQAAALAKRSGLPKLALARLQTLIDTYPRSELAHNARVEQFRLLRDTGETELARASARSYLERYPSGFAAAEARRLLESGDDAP
jgi:hypothetical protein